VRDRQGRSAAGTSDGVPAEVDISPGRIGWIQAEVEEWVESRKRDLPVALDELSVDERLLVFGSRGVRRGPAHVGLELKCSSGPFRGGPICERG
jgi:hypothetical protein